MASGENVINQLYEVLVSRKNTNPEQSYVSSLYTKGLNKILKKIGEECIEVIIAAKNQNRKELIHEIADLFFHCMVLMADQDVLPADITKELQKRFGVSGLTEKASRKP